MMKGDHESTNLLRTNNSYVDHGNLYCNMYYNSIPAIIFNAPSIGALI